MVSLTTVDSVVKATTETIFSHSKAALSQFFNSLFYFFTSLSLFLSLSCSRPLCLTCKLSPTLLFNFFLLLLLILSVKQKKILLCPSPFSNSISFFFNSISLSPFKYLSLFLKFSPVLFSVLNLIHHLSLSLFPNNLSLLFTFFFYLILSYLLTYSITLYSRLAQSIISSILIQNAIVLSFYL